MLAGFSRSEAPKRTRNLGTTSSVKAKLWALKDGLNLGQQLGINNINAEMDIEVLVYMFMKPSSINFMLEPLLSDCRGSTTSGGVKNFELGGRTILLR